MPLMSTVSTTRPKLTHQKEDSFLRLSQLAALTPVRRVLTQFGPELDQNPALQRATDSIPVSAWFGG
jgi:hypothetical protein